VSLYGERQAFAFGRGRARSDRVRGLFSVSNVRWPIKINLLR